MTRKNQKILWYWLSFPLPPVAIYLGLSFIIWQPNPQFWSEELRFVYVGVSIAAVCLMLALVGSWYYDV